MDSKKKLQLSVIIGSMALLLVVVLVAGILLMPNSPKPPVVDGNNSEVVTPVEVQKYDVTGRIFDKDGNPLANTKFCISLGPTDFTTDENGFFILKNLPVGIYTIFGYDSDGNRIGATDLQLSSDGAVSVNYYTFEKGEIVTLGFDGEKFYAVEVKENNNSNGSENSDDDDKSEDLNDNVEAEEDETYTNLSWMKNEAPGFGGYGITPYRDPEMFEAILNNPDCDMFNTYFLAGNLEFCKYAAEKLTKAGKQMWLSILDTTMLSAKNPADPRDKLAGNWREVLDEYMHEIYAIAGSQFCGFYFDEPNLHITEMDFIRVTEYIRKTYNRRVFVVHNAIAFTTPASKGFDLIGYKPGRNDGLILSEKNHKYVTDVAYWRYASLRRYGGFKTSTTEWKKAVSLLNENARLWFVPPIGTYDWLTVEEETVELIYEMYKYHIQFPNFGGIMLYAMSYGPLSGGPSYLTDETHSMLTEDDFLKENGAYVFQTSNGKRVTPDSAGRYYYVITKTENGESVKKDVYMKLNAKGEREYYYDVPFAEDIPFAAEEPDSNKLSRVIVLSVNNSPISVPGTNAYAEGGGYYFTLDKLPDGSYRWPIARQYMFTLGKGLQAVGKGEKTYQDILKELEAIFTPDRSKYLKSNRWWE